MNKNIIVYFVILFLILLISIGSIKSNRIIKNYMNKDIKSNSEICKNNNIDDLTEEDKYYCEALDKNIKQGSFFYYYRYLLGTGINKTIIFYLLPLVILYPILYSLHLEYNDEYIKKYLENHKYKSYVKRILLKSYKYIFLVIFILVIYGLISFKMSNFNYNPLMDIGLGQLGSNMLSFYTNYKMYIYYFLIIIFNTAAIINIGLVLLKNIKSYKKCILISCIINYLLNYFITIFVGMTLLKQFNIVFENCTMQDIYTWFIIQDGNILLIINIILFTITFIYFAYSYKSRESFILRCQMLD